MTYTWLLFSLTAAVLWGFSYAVSERVLQSGISPSLLSALVSCVTLPLYFTIAALRHDLKPGLTVFMEKPGILIMAILMAIGIAVGNYLILHSIILKNATYATLIEITYPLFTCLFAWVLFREMQVNAYTAVGALLIFSGLGIIFLKS